VPTESRTLILLLPEIVLLAMAVWIFVGGAFARSRSGWCAFALAALGVSALALARQDMAMTGAGLAQAAKSVTDSVMVVGLQFDSGPALVDHLSLLLRWGALAIGVLFVLASWRSGQDELVPEMLGSLLLLIVGLMLTSLAGELVFLFLALELVSIPTYVLLFLGRRNLANGEATIKYFFLSLLSSALLLYGFALIYGAAGSAYVAEIHRSLIDQAGLSALGLGESLAPLGAVLVLVGLAFKIAAAPFHFYAPDVFQGTSNLNAALLSIAPKVAAVAALLRLAPTLAVPLEAFGWQLIVVISILTMTLGNVCALWQSNMRRLMAYSSIAHAGYLLLGLAVAVWRGDSESMAVGGAGAMVFYLAVYAAATLGLFATLRYLGGSRGEIEDVSDLSGLARRRPWAAGMLAVFLLSLTGLPPLAGFVGKFALFSAAVDVAISQQERVVWLSFAVLVVAAVINAAIGAAYYLRVVAVMFFQGAGSPAEEETGSRGPLVTAGVCGAIVLLLGLLPGPALRTTREADAALRLLELRQIEAAPRAVSSADAALLSRPLRGNR